MDEDVIRRFRRSEKRSRDAKKNPPTQKHFIDSIPFHYQFPNNLHVNGVKWYTFSIVTVESYIVDLASCLAPSVFPKSNWILRKEKPIQFYLFSRHWISMVLPKEKKNRTNIVRELSKHGGSDVGKEGKRERKTKKLILWNCSVIYLSFVFIMFHLLSNSFRQEY